MQNTYMAHWAIAQGGPNSKIALPVPAAAVPPEPPTPPNYTISVSADTGGSASVDGASSVTVQQGNNVTCVATPNTDYRFIG